MATPKAGLGTLLKVCDADSPANAKTLGKVRDISGPNRSANTYESTTQESIATEFDPGIKSDGEVTFSLLYDVNDADHVALDTYVGQTRYYQLAIGNSSPAKTRTFKGIMTAMAPSYPVAGLQSANITIKVSGLSTLA